MAQRPRRVCPSINTTVLSGPPVTREKNFHLPRNNKSVRVGALCMAGKKRSPTRVAAGPRLYSEPLAL